MQIMFERTGGIIGRKISLTIDLNDLPSDQAAMMRGLLDHANFFTLVESPPNHPNPDGFNYTITVETELVKHTVYTTDITAPKELQPLLEELSQRTRIQRNT
jgi:hypothetical protein